MVCSSCGTQNAEGSKFCIKCGNMLNVVDSSLPNLSAENNVNKQSQINNQMGSQNVINNEGALNQNILGSTVPPVNETINQNMGNMQATQNSNNQISQSQNQGNNIKLGFMQYIFSMLAVILRPFSSLGEELNKFNSFKNSAIISVIISVFATLISLIKTIYSAVRVQTYTWSEGYVTSWEWENLKDLNYVQIIGKNFLIYLGAIFAIAIIYYIASLIIKKDCNFQRLLAVSALGVIPLLVSAMILSPLLSLIYSPLGMGITIIGGVYSLLIIYEGMNNEILLDGNAKYYFNLICLSIIAIAGYYLIMNMFVSSVTSDWSSILDLFS